MKKLIPALCMLLVAAALMGTSTFAWFSMSTEVAATGLNVKASTPVPVLISGDNKTWGYSVSLADDTTTTLDPASASFNGGTATWFQGEAASADSSAVNTDGYKAAASDSTYMITKDLYLKPANDNAKGHGITVTSIDVTGATDSAHNQSLRVVLVMDSTAYYFAPLRTAAPAAGFKYVMAAGAAGSEGTLADVTLSAGTKELIAASIDGGATGGLQDSKNIKVYVFFDGMDPECKNSSITNVDKIVLTINFNADVPTGG